MRRFQGYNKRDLMVEGSGFLQWLSVYALATSPQVDVLLLDEPDAHLHPTLQAQLMESLEELARIGHKQVLVATHSAELLRHWDAKHILEIRTKGVKTRYLSSDYQKVGLLAGLGSDYAPRLDPVRREGRVLFLEGDSDLEILSVIEKKLGLDCLRGWPVWITSRHHKERKQLFLAFQEDIPGLVAVSLRDRDDEPVATSNSNLDDLNSPGTAAFVTLKWRRRHIESYLILPSAVARATGQTVDTVAQQLANNHALAVGAGFTDSDCPDALKEADGKEILSGGAGSLLGGSGRTPADVARALRADEICDDFATFFTRLQGAARE